MKLISLIFLLFSCSPHYVYIGGITGQDTAVHSINHALESKSTYGATIGTGWTHDRFGYGVEFDYNHREAGLDTTNLRIVCTYDVMTRAKWEVFVGLAGGLGWSWDDDYDLLCAERDSEGLTGVMDLRVGLRFDLSDRTQLKVQYRLNHISRPFIHDRGSNTDEIELGFVIHF